MGLNTIPRKSHAPNYTKNSSSHLCLVVVFNFVGIIYYINYKQVQTSSKGLERKTLALSEITDVCHALVSGFLTIHPFVVIFRFISVFQ